MQELLTVDEVATLLRVKPQTIYLWAGKKQMPSQKVGSALRFDEAQLKAWLDLQKRGPSTFDEAALPL